MFIDYRMFILNGKCLKRTCLVIHFDNEYNCEKRTFFYQKKKKSFYNFVRQKYIVPLVKNKMFQKILIRFEIVNLHLPVLRTVMSKTSM